MKTYLKVPKLLTSKQDRSKALTMEAVFHVGEQCGTVGAGTTSHLGALDKLSTFSEYVSSP